MDKTVVGEVVHEEQAVSLNKQESACDAETNSVKECFDIGGNDEIKLQRDTLEISDRVSLDKVMIEDNCDSVRNKELTSKTLPGYISNENMAVKFGLSLPLHVVMV